MEKQTMKEIPVNDRPYERCIRQGPEALSDEELLSVIIRTGSRKAGRATCSPFRSITTQDLRAEMGRHSSICTTSPSLHRLASSCAAYFFERRMNFL